jgi:hypothetical protein
MSGISMKGLFGSLRSSDVSPSMYGYNPIKYYCISCGTVSKERIASSVAIPPAFLIM